MNKAYYCCGWRAKEEEIKAHFIRLCRDQEIILEADRKSNTWCVPKLEKHMMDAEAFVAAVPFRDDQDAICHVSPYMAVEIALARRAGLPRLLFVEDRLLPFFGQLTQEDAVPFARESLQRDTAVHLQRIHQFKTHLQARSGRRLPGLGSRRASVFLEKKTEKSGIPEILARILKSQTYQPRLVKVKELADCANNMSALDLFLDSELAVFCLEGRRSALDVALGMAHAWCLPTFRLRRESVDCSCEPDLSGFLRWHTAEKLEPVFQAQVRSYYLGFVQAVSETENAPTEWDFRIPEMLIHYIEVGDPILREDVEKVQDRLGKSSLDLVAKGKDDELCRAAYEVLQAYHWLYTGEKPSKDYSKQRIRSPWEVRAQPGGTCLDLVCYFAALLEAMLANPVIVRLKGVMESHALAGCWVKKRPGRAIIRDKKVVLDALEAGNLFLVETTGLAKNYKDHVPPEECPEGVLTYERAKLTADQKLRNKELDFLLDIRVARLG